MKGLLETRLDTMRVPSTAGLHRGHRLLNRRPAGIHRRLMEDGPSPLVSP